MQIHRTSSSSATTDLAPTLNHPASTKQNNWNNTVAKISGLTAGLAVFSMGTSYVLGSATKFAFGCSSRNFENQVNCLDLVWYDAMKFMIVCSAGALTAGFAAGKVTESAIQALKSALKAFRDFRAGKQQPAQPS